MKPIAGIDYGSSTFMGRLAQMYLSEGNILQADTCMKKGWERAGNRLDSVALYVSSAQMNDRIGEHQNAYQELLKRRNLNLLEDCKDCPIYGFCRGGCLITKEANETSEKQKAMCKLYVEMTKAIIDESIDA